MLIRTCRECGRLFWGGPRAFYCPECRLERRREHEKEFKRRKKLGDVIPNGSIVKCEGCGKEIIKNGGRQRFCDLCAAKHLKEVDNAQSLEWKNANRDTYREAKRRFRQKRQAEDHKIDTLMPGVFWDVEKHIFIASICLGGKQKVILKTRLWKWAFAARVMAERLKSSGRLDDEVISMIPEMCRLGQIKLTDYVSYTQIQMEVYERYLNGVIQADIAREMECSRQRVSQILQSIAEKNIRAQKDADDSQGL